MNKNFLVLLIIIFLQGCSGQTSSYISSGLTLASGGFTTKNVFATGSNLYIENNTGKIRECKITHSAEINKIFFETLDEVDCKL